MAIAFDAKGSSVDTGTDNQATLTVGSLTNGVLLIVKTRISADAASTPTVNGSATGVTLWNQVDDGAVFEDVYYKVAPASGATTVAGGDCESIAAASYSGVDQATPLATAAEATGSGITPTVNVSTTIGEVVIDFVAWNAIEGAVLATGAGAGQTVRVNDGTRLYGIGISEETATGATTTMSWTLDTGDQPWVTMAGVLNAAAAGATDAQKMVAVNQFTATGGMVGRVYA